MRDYREYLKIAENKGTPLYVYDLRQLKQRLDFFFKHKPKNSQVHFALKSNNNKDILRILKSKSVGVDVVSIGEIEHARKAGFMPKQMVFSGVGKTENEIQKALKYKVAQINIESLPELERIAKISRKLKTTAQVAFRMNPDVDTQTHPYIRTGFRDNKFGLDFSEIPELLNVCKKNKKNLKLIGLALHIGSQIRDVSPFKAAIQKTCELYKALQAQGYQLQNLDVGGGLGIDYSSDNLSADEELLKNYFKAVAEVTDKYDLNNLFFEPGRILVARAGVLLAEVQYVKVTPHKKFVILNTGMHHLIRPALYQAEHRIEVLSKKPKDSPQALFDVVGPICESSDVLGFARSLPTTIAAGDIVAIHDVGAYGATMSSDYNLHPRALEAVLD